MMYWFNNLQQMKASVDSVAEVQRLEYELYKITASLEDAKARARGQWLISRLLHNPIGLEVEPEEGETQRMFPGPTFVKGFTNIIGYNELVVTHNGEIELSTTAIKLYDNGYLEIDGGFLYGTLHFNISNFAEWLKEKSF